MEELKNYIAGELVPAVSKATLDNWSPAVGEIYSKVPDSDERDVALAIKAAAEAFPAWSKLPVSERSRWLRRLAQSIELHRNELSLAEAIDTGKPSTVAAAVD